jgi:PAS domain-containing protein
MHDRQGLMLLDMSTPKWSIHLVNEAWHRITGVGQEMAAGSRFWDLFEAPPPAQVGSWMQMELYLLHCTVAVGGSSR